MSIAFAAGKDVSGTRVGLGLVLVAISLFACLAARILTYELRADEQLYISPAALLEDAGLYTDFFYNHVPLSAFYYRLAYIVLGGDHLVLSARLATIVAWGITAAAVWTASLAISRSQRMALFCYVALVANVYLLTVPGMTATNNFLQVSPAYAGLSLFTLAVLDQRGRAWKAFLSGVALSVAVGVKISAAYLIPPLALAALFLPRDLGARDRLWSVTLPMALGGLIGALPLFVYLISFPDVFLAHVVGYHVGPHVAWWEIMRHTEPSLAFDLGGKLLLAFEIWFQSTNLLILAAIFMLAGLAFAGPGRIGAGLLGPCIAVAVATVFTAVLCFLPTPAFPQYFILPLPGMLMLPALLWRALPAERRLLAEPLLLALLVLVVLLALPRLVEPVAKLALGAPTTPERVEAAAEQIRAAMERAGADGPVATLSPLYPLEADLPVYPALATGPFAYRVVPVAAPDILKYYVTVGPDQVAALLDRDPPAAILTGFDPELERPFVDWAEANGYKPDPTVSFTDRYGEAKLWLPAPGP